MVEKSVLSPKLAAGPHGIGDPDDKSLRKVEKNVLIPQRVRDISRNEKCVEEVQEFTKCCANSSVLMVVKCRKENSALKACLTKWFYDEDLRKRCLDEYLEERSEYRRTGISKSLRH